MDSFIKIWVIGWLVMVAWYLIVLLSIMEGEAMELRGRFVRDSV